MDQNKWLQAKRKLFLAFVAPELKVHAYAASIFNAAEMCMWETKFNTFLGQMKNVK